MKQEKTLPHNPDLEQQILAALIMQPQTLFDVDTILRPSSFYETANRILYTTISYLVNANKATDIVAIAQRLRETNQLEAIGGVLYLSEITAQAWSISHLTEKAYQLREIEMQRDIIALSLSTADAAYSNEPIADTVERMEKQLTDLQTSATRAQAVPMPDIIDAFFRSLQDTENFRPAIPTGLAGLNKALNGGFHAPDLIIVGGRPSMGKTQFALHFAEKAAEAVKDTKGTVLFFSIEMTAEQLLTRYIAKSVPLSSIRNHSLLPDELQSLKDYADHYRQLPIKVVDSTEAAYLTSIKSIARRQKRTGSLNMILIDYLQLIQTRGQHFDKRYQEVGYITRELKMLAKELNVCIILLAQLSRPAKGMEKREPTMDDLRESGDIEQDADIILFPVRPSVIDPQAVDESGNSWYQRGKIIVAKNREGRRNVECRFSHDKGFKSIFEDTL